MISTVLFDAMARFDEASNNFYAPRSLTLVTTILAANCISKSNGTLSEIFGFTSAARMAGTMVVVSRR